MPDATPDEIESFLEKIRSTLPISFIPRNNEKNRETLTALGYNWKIAAKEIEILSIENYSEGPTQEHGTINKVWIFGKFIQGHEIYIKIKLIGTNNRNEEIDTVYCHSFHFAKDCLNYPYKK